MTISQVVLESIRWYATLSAFAWLMYPLIYRGLAALPDRGISIVRPLGLLLAALVPWWLSAVGILPYTTPWIIAIPAVIALIAWAHELRAGKLAGFLREKILQVALYELVTLMFFFGYVAFRSFNPAIQHTEKPMELAFLTSTEHSVSMPPADPWFLGHTINYYYLGYLLMSLPARIAQILPSHAFTLALATLFATATLGAAGTAVNLMRSLGHASKKMLTVAGLLGGIFLVGVGNLYTPLKFIEHPLRTLHAGWWNGVSWNASRIITDGPGAHTINEFPAFSFVLGDLHPHILAYPMFISSIGVGLALVRAGRRFNVLLPTAALAGILAASLYATNSWDMPPALLMALIGILIATIGMSRSQKAIPLGVLFASTIVTVLPFELHYTPAVGLPASSVPESIRSTPILGKLVETIGIVSWPTSSTREIFTVHGLFLLIAILFLVPIVLPVIKAAGYKQRTVAALVAALFLASVLIRFPGLFWFVGPLEFIFVVLVMGKLCPPHRYLVALFGITFLLLSITELVFLEDAFSNRMNTVFKLYFQVWALFAVGCSVALPITIKKIAQNSGRIRAMGIAAPIGLMIVGAMLYPPISAYHWTSGFSHFSGVDGLQYFKQTAPNEMAAIDWLNAHASPTDRLLEAPGCSYGEAGTLPENYLAGAYGVAGTIPHNLFSMATGLQTPLGWQFHEYQWRLGDPSISSEIAQRKADVATIYNTPTSPEAQNLLKSYDITYIIDGPIEQNGYGSQCDGGAPYSAVGLQELGHIGWPLAFQSGNVKIYQHP